VCNIGNNSTSNATFGDGDTDACSTATIFNAASNAIADEPSKTLNTNSETSTGGISNADSNYDG
jgi:hypothetical protein